MRLIDHWLDYHHFHHEDVVEFKNIVKKGWEAALFAGLFLMLVYTVTILISPELAFWISRFFL